MDGTAQGGGFEKFPLGMIARQQNGHLGFQSHNPSRRIGAHLLHRLHQRPLQLDPVPLRHDPHDRCHTGRNGGGDEIGRRKAFPFALVIDRGIRGQFRAGWAVDRFTVKLPLVADGDFYGQGRINPDRRLGNEPNRRRRPRGT